MKDSWLTDKGELIEVGQTQHNKYAFELLREEMGLDNTLDYLDDNNIYPFEELHTRGWVKIRVQPDNTVEISGNCIDLTKPQRNTVNPKMNRVQLKVAKRICRETNTDFHKAINDKRFW